MIKFCLILEHGWWHDEPGDWNDSWNEEDNLFRNLLLSFLESPLQSISTTEKHNGVTVGHCIVLASLKTEGK